MCEVIERKKLRSLNEGIALGKAEGSQKTYVSACKEFGCAYEETIERFMNRFHVSAEESREIVNRYWPMN